MVIPNHSHQDDEHGGQLTPERALRSGFNAGQIARQTLRGGADVVDGDTVTIGGVTFEFDVIATDTGVNTANGELNNTTEASAGTEAVLYEEQVNSRVGLHYIPTPEQRRKTDQAAGLLVVRLLTAPADALLMSGTIDWEEG